MNCCNVLNSFITMIFYCIFQGKCRHGRTWQSHDDLMREEIENARIDVNVLKFKSEVGFHFSLLSKENV